jgi:hypothetical protein
MAAYRPLPERVPQLLGRRGECDVLDRLMPLTRKWNLSRARGSAGGAGLVARR